MDSCSPRRSLLFGSWAVLAALLLLVASSVAAEGHWPQWRGPLGTGVGPAADPPISWAEGRNVRWKVGLPGVGHSSPIVWGDRIFVTTAIPQGEAVAVRGDHAHGAHNNVDPSRVLAYAVLALDRADGRVVWSRTVRTAQPHASAHETAGWASPSPVTDGKTVFASFGSQGVYALNLDGKVLWERDLGDLIVKHGHGEGSSPALRDGLLVVNWDHEGASFLVALDATTGKDRWRVERGEATSWSTPLIVDHDGTTQVVVSATKRIRSYDLATGALLWECGGLSDNVVATPVAGDGMVYAGSSYDFAAMVGIRLDGAKGDRTGTDSVVWKLDRLTPYVPSPLLVGDTLYFLRHSQGLLSALVAKTGQVRFGPLRLAGIHNVYASPVAAADRVYVVGREGTTVVLAADGSKVLATNTLDDVFAASPALAGRDLVLRGERYLYALAESVGSPAAQPSTPAKSPATTRPAASQATSRPTQP